MINLYVNMAKITLLIGSILLFIERIWPDNLFANFLISLAAVLFVISISFSYNLINVRKIKS